MTYSSIVLLSMLIHLIVNNDVFKKDDDKRFPAKRKYRWFLISVTFFYIADAFWGVLYEHKLVQLVYIDTILFFLSMALTVFFYTRFVIEYLNEKGLFSKILKVCGELFLAFEATYLIINAFYPVMFSFDFSTGNYETKSGRYITLLVQIVLFFATAVYSMIVCLKSYGRLRFRNKTISISGFVMAICIILQALDPYQALYSLGCILSTCIIHTFVIEDEKTEYRKELERLLARERDVKQQLGNVKSVAYTDALTGVKSAAAYNEASAKIEAQLADKTLDHFGLIVFDVNGLKTINDTQGHEIGDNYIRAASSLICRWFKHSSVFRIGGDEFVAFLGEDDYRNRNSILNNFDMQVDLNAENDNVVVASGLAIYEPDIDTDIHSIFVRADKAMYNRKQALKGIMKYNI